MSNPDLNDIPYRVFRGRIPSFTELLSEAQDLSALPLDGPLSPEDLAYYRRWTPKLRYAAKWEWVQGWPLRRFLLKIGALRYGVWAGILAVAIVLIQTTGSSNDPAGDISMLVVLEAMAFGAGAIAASVQWFKIRARHEEATEYRVRRVDYEARLWSPAGIDGWRLLDLPDGNARLVREPTTPGTGV